MPVGRLKVRNEYSLGSKELYNDAVLAEDPKGVLDGVAVAGLVGILRQLGDLSEFAAEVFHGLQEQLASTSSRSRKLVKRVQRVEAMLPQLEKAMLSQTSHIHFAYTPGTEWHPRIRIERNHFIYDDLPHFLLDSYEECREPPRLQLLDRFDTSGAGSCLKRYSDPTFFKRASATSEACNSRKPQDDRKARKAKRRRSWQRNGQLQNGAPFLNSSGRMLLSSSTAQGKSSLSHTGTHTGSTFNMTFKSDVGDQSDSAGSRAGTNSLEYGSHQRTSQREDEITEFSSVRHEDMEYDNKLTDNDKRTAISESCSPAVEMIIPSASGVTWDEKMEIIEGLGQNFASGDIQDVHETNVHLNEQDLQSFSSANASQAYALSKCGNSPKPYVDVHNFKKTNDDILDVTGTNSDTDEQDIEPCNSEGSNDVDNSAGINEIQEVLEKSEPNVHQLELGNIKCSSTVEDSCEDENPWESNMKCFSSVEGSCEDENPRESTFEENQLDGPAHEIPPAQSLVLANMESLGRAADQYEGETLLKSGDDENLVENHNNSGLAIIELPHVFETKIDTAQRDLGGLSIRHLAQENTVSQGRNDMAIVEWNPLDEGDSETDNYVDALNTIESESESDFEIHAKKDLVSVLRPALEENKSEQKAQLICYHEPECRSVSNDEVQHLSASLASGNVETLEYALSSCNESTAAESQKPEELSCLSDQSVSFHNTTTSVDVCKPVLCGMEASGSQAPHDEIITAAAASQAGPDDGAICSPQGVQEIRKASVSQASHMTDMQSSGSQAPDEETINAPFDSLATSNEKVICYPHLRQEKPVASSDPLAFWTNGTLLGLQPSKPTVLSTRNIANSAPVGIDNSTFVGQSVLNSIEKIDISAGTAVSLVKNSECGKNIGEVNSNDIGPSLPDDNQNTVKKLDMHVHPDYRNLIDHGLSNGSILPDNGTSPASDHMKNVSSAVTTTSEDRSSILTLLGRGLLRNGLRRTGSLGSDEKPKATEPLRGLSNGGIISASQSAFDASSKGRLDSPSSSPPLEHMKIFFRPVDKFETSRLKLKYPEGLVHHEGMVDTFPSFQLVPEPSDLKPDVGSDSDDDTFCRSYACMSDDYLSNLSDSNSEEWESGDTSESHNDALYDGLRGIASPESASDSPKRDETRHGGYGVKHSSSRNSFNLPILDTNNPFIYKDMKTIRESEETDSSHVMEPNPQLPPLPPMQWRALKPRSDAEEGKEDPVCESLNQCNDPKIVVSGIRPIANLVSTLSRSGELVAVPTMDKVLGEKKVDNLKQNIQATNEIKTDDREDFLHQIRTKSFNLRRTERAQPAYTTSTSSGYNMTAMLQKADAIRQAVGSDDGEDDSWSDTS